MATYPAEDSPSSLRYRDIPRPGPWALTLLPNDDKPESLPSDLSEQAEDCLWHMTKYPNDEKAYQRQLLKFLDELVLPPSASTDLPGITFQVGGAGIGFDLTEVCVVNEDEDEQKDGDSFSNLDKSPRAGTQSDFDSYSRSPAILGAVSTSRRKRPTSPSRGTPYPRMESVGGGNCTFCPFITGTIKIKTDQAVVGLAQGICHLHRAYQLSGCYVGLVIVHARFSRVIMLDESVVIIETLNTSLQGRLESIPQALDHADIFDAMPHSFGTHHEIDISGWKYLWNTVYHAASLVMDLNVDEPLRRVKRPSTTTWTKLCEKVLLAQAQNITLGSTLGVASDVDVDVDVWNVLDFDPDPDSDAELDENDRDPMHEEHTSIVQQVSRLIDFGVRVFWIDSEFMTALIERGVSDVC